MSSAASNNGTREIDHFGSSFGLISPRLPPNSPAPPRRVRGRRSPLRPPLARKRCAGFEGAEEAVELNWPLARPINSQIASQSSHQTRTQTHRSTEERVGRACALPTPLAVRRQRLELGANCKRAHCNCIAIPSRNANCAQLNSTQLNLTRAEPSRADNSKHNQRHSQLHLCAFECEIGSNGRRSIV